MDTAPEVPSALRHVPISTMSEALASDRAALNLAEVAAILQVDQRTVSSSVRAGELPVVRLGRRRLIPRERFLAIFAVEQGAEK